MLALATINNADIRIVRKEAHGWQIHRALPHSEGSKGKKTPMKEVWLQL